MSRWILTRSSTARGWSTMNELLLAGRNLLRNRRRSLSTLLTLAIGLMAVLLFGGFKTNIKYSMLTAYIRTGGHLQIQHKDFFVFGGGNPTAYGISGYQALLDAIRADEVLKPMVAVVTPMLRFGGLAGNFDAGISRTVIGTGYVPADINAMRRWNEFQVPIVHPHFKLEGAVPDAAIVGVGVARVLMLCERLAVENCPKPAESGSATPDAKGAALPADIAALAKAEAPRAGTTAGAGVRVDLLSSSSKGAPNVAALNVVAAEDQGFKELDEVSVILQMPYAQRLVYGRVQPRATALMVQLNRTANMRVASERLNQIIAAHPGGDVLSIKDVEELNPFYVQSIQLFDVIFGFIFVLIGGVVLFTVGNTMNAAVVERTVEIGTLRAVGLRQAGIRRLFVIEGLLLGVAGAVVGVVAAITAAAIVNKSGMTWLPPGSSERLPLQLRVIGETSTIVFISLAIVVAAVLSAWLPAWRAAKLNVVDALRHA